jgi:hypothetical protein
MNICSIVGRPSWLNRSAVLSHSSSTNQSCSYLVFTWRSYTGYIIVSHVFFHVHDLTRLLSPFNNDTIHLSGGIPTAGRNCWPPLHCTWHRNVGGIPNKRENDGQDLRSFEEQEWWSWEARVQIAFVTFPLHS